MKIWVLAVCMVSVVTSIYGYHKFRCMDCLLAPQENASFVAPSFSLHKASYVMIDTHGIITSYVYLSALDKRAIGKQLRLCKPGTLITQNLINKYKRQWGRKQIVGLVLQDFKAMKPTATVDDVLKALQL